MTTLANAIVDNGDYEQAENLVEKAAAEGLLQEYLRREWAAPAVGHVSPSSAQACSSLSHHVLHARACLSSFNAKGQTYKANWEPIIAVDHNGNEQSGDSVPGPRGGHQLAIDTKRSLLYLFGGWDGVVRLLTQERH
jgi:hypothetical protein